MTLTTISSIDYYDGMYGVIVYNCFGHSDLNGDLWYYRILMN